MTRGAPPSPRAERGTRAALAMMLAFLAAAPVGAAPLCRDLKGLFTPCPAGGARDGTRAAAVTADAVSSAGGDAPPPRQRSTKPPRVARTKLCRDLKGLFTPCPG